MPTLTSEEMRRLVEATVKAAGLAEADLLGSYERPASAAEGRSAQ